jgi:Tol biopolymer transport system component
MKKTVLISVVVLMSALGAANAAESDHEKLQLVDIFELEYAADPQIYCRWMDTGQTARLSRLQSSPRDVVWSPDGSQIAFSMLVAAPPGKFVPMPAKPKGAEWAEPPKVIRKLRYRSDGAGYLKDGYFHVVVLPAEGGTPRQITSGDFNHRELQRCDGSRIALRVPLVSLCLRGCDGNDGFHSGFAS